MGWEVRLFVGVSFVIFVLSLCDGFKCWWLIFGVDCGRWCVVYWFVFVYWIYGWGVRVISWENIYELYWWGWFISIDFK